MGKNRKKVYLNIKAIKRQIKKLTDEAVLYDMMDNSEMMLKKLNEVEVLRSMLAEYKEGTNL